MKRVGLILLAVFVVFAFTVSGADAGSKKKCSNDGKKHEQPHKDGSSGAGFFEHMIKKLDLSEEQAAEAGKIKLSYKKAVIRQDAEIKVAGVELQELLGADKVDLRKAERKIKDIYDMKAELKLYRITEMENFKELLTPEQKKKLKSCMLKGAMHGKSMKHHGK
ncbi:hypothetical protein MNBD_DELTA01-2088 [hydrothermal vent metagenome]|uniref:Periplasmic heavy metal sensor n=1 Tax=hydrothermal vent metagenome TaxID=652676 RepID=A0A3B0RJH8_9ZZZZ